MSVIYLGNGEFQFRDGSSPYTIVVALSLQASVRVLPGAEYFSPSCTSRDWDSYHRVGKYSLDTKCSSRGETFLCYLHKLLPTRDILKFLISMWLLTSHSSEKNLDILLSPTQLLSHREDLGIVSYMSLWWRCRSLLRGLSFPFSHGPVVTGSKNQIWKLDEGLNLHLTIDIILLIS